MNKEQIEKLINETKGFDKRERVIKSHAVEIVEYIKENFDGNDSLKIGSICNMNFTYFSNLNMLEVEDLDSKKSFNYYQIYL